MPVAAWSTSSAWNPAPSCANCRRPSSGLIERHRLVTVTGPPGTGKTRLALEAAARAASGFRDGAGLVRLDTVTASTVTTNTCLAAAVTAALDQPDQGHDSAHDGLVAALADHRALLVLDNCEHVLAASAHLVEALLRACPKLHILATSREPLGLAVEHTYPLDPLLVPQQDSVDSVLAAAAGRLLVERARAVDPGFEASPRTATDIAGICRMVGGLPLAIELAAGRLRALTVRQVADRLGGRLDLLSSRRRQARHSSLQAAIDWSYEQLPSWDRKVFARLSVFRGGFTLESAEAVTSDEGQSPGAVLDALCALVDRSLVITDPQERPAGMRYRLLEPLREYAACKLRDSAEHDATRGRHARHFCALAELADSHRRGPSRNAWLESLRREYANLRAAMTWSQERHEHELGLRLVAALSWFWKHHATSEALVWLNEIIAASEG